MSNNETSKRDEPIAVDRDVGAQPTSTAAPAPTASPMTGASSAGGQSVSPTLYTSPPAPTSPDIELLYQRVYRMVGDPEQKIYLLDSDKIGPASEIFRSPKRKYKSRERQQELRDFEAHVSKLSLLNPLLVVDIAGAVFLVSGQKRLDAARSNNSRYARIAAWPRTACSA
jgi:hypothetical protein